MNMLKRESTKNLDDIKPDRSPHSELIYSGKVVSLFVDRVKMQDGKEVTREKITHPGAVAVVPKDRDGNIILIRQYRHAVDRILWEIPAGKIEPNEDPEDCARREMMEETGWCPGCLKKVASFYTAPGFASEIIHLYIAEDLYRKEADRDEDEDIIVYSLSQGECMELIKTGQIEDAKTIIGLLLTAGEMR